MGIAIVIAVGNLLAEDAASQDFRNIELTEIFKEKIIELGSPEEEILFDGQNSISPFHLVSDLSKLSIGMKFAWPTSCLTLDDGHINKKFRKLFNKV
jgi:hypothetical protein